MKRSTITDVLAGVLVLLFVYAATAKLLAHHSFVMQLHTHPYLKRFAWSLSWCVPVTELAVAGLLLSPRRRKPGFACAAVLLLLFSAYLLLMLGSGKPLPCSCGGFVSALTWREHIVFNGVLILLSIVGIWLEERAKIFYKGSAIKKQSVRTV